jgi:hypothetical protein
MFPILPMDVPRTMRSSLSGALATDPVRMERRHVAREAAARRAPRRGRFVRKPATAQQSS